MKNDEPPQANAANSPCQTCGACCSYSADWPRFTFEDDDTLAQLPSHLINDRQSGMRCDGARCRALAGDIGVSTACTVYEDRPEVCRECQPGDEECNMARRKFGMPEIFL